MPYIDKLQEEQLTIIQSLLDAGELSEVRDIPEYWRQYTSVELQYILDYYKESTS